MIWFGAKASDENDTFSDNREGGILGEVALRSGGEIFRVTEEALGPNSELGLVSRILFFCTKYFTCGHTKPEVENWILMNKSLSI